MSNIDYVPSWITDAFTLLQKVKKCVAQIEANRLDIEDVKTNLDAVGEEIDNITETTEGLTERVETLEDTIEGKQDTLTEGDFISIVDDTISVEASETATANTIPKRDTNGNLKGNTPIADNDLANKKYIDDKVINPAVVYCHDITIDTNYKLIVYSTSATAITSFSALLDVAMVGQFTPDKRSVSKLGFIFSITETQITIKVYSADAWTTHIVNTSSTITDTVVQV